MMKIAILGGYGDVGSAACRFLLSLNLEKLGVNELCIGGRQAIERQAVHQASLRKQLSEHLSAEQTLSYHNVDFQDPVSLGRFVEGCQLVLNCAGPSHVIGDKVAKVAARQGVIYIDVAGDDPLYADLDNAVYQQKGLTAVLSAGLQPGLTGLFPRWLAEQIFDTVDSLESYFGVRDRFTGVAAQDYLQVATGQATSEQQAQSLSLNGAVWQKGDIVNGVLTRQNDVSLAFFTDTVTTLPMLSSENIRSAESLKLSYGAWYNAIAGKHILTAFNQVHGVSKSEAITALCRASELDLVGRQPYALMLLQMRGTLTDHTREQVRTAVLQSAPGCGNAQLSGAMAAVTVKAALNNQIAAGVHYCAQVLSPTAALSELRHCQALNTITILETSIEAMASPEEGAI